MNKNLLKISLLLVVVAFIGFSSCNEDDPIVTNKFTFNKVNYAWTYLDTETGEPSDTFTQKINADLGGGKYQVISDYGTPDADTMVWLITDNEFAEIQDSSKITYLLIDAKVGDTYTSIDGTDTTVIKVASVSKSVTVPAGTFSCFQVDIYVFSQVFATLYINKDAGIVKIEILGGYATQQMLSKNF